MDGFDPQLVFNDDFSYFYADRIGGERTERELALLRSIAAFNPGDAVLDFCCGDGRIANALGRQSLKVVGLDSSSEYLIRARHTASMLESDTRFVHGDARHLPFNSAFDVVLCWYTSFGYFDDEINRQMLGEIRHALRRGGYVVLDLDSKAHLLKSKLPTQVRERGSDVMVEQFHFNATNRRVEATRTVVRGDEVRRTSYFVRLFEEGELRSWLADTGFGDIHFFGEDGLAFGSTHRRMIVLARLQ